MADNQVKFKRGSASEYAALETKDPDDIYITTDDGKIYLGDKALGGGETDTNIVFATCSTAANVAAKVATIDTGSTFSLTKGAIVAVKFSNTNTASNTTLNVANTGAKSIYYNNAVYTANSAVAGYKDRYILYMYNGTYWVWVSQGADNNTTNTAGATDTSSKIFLIGATSQASNPQTYSHDTAYVGTDGCLYSNSKKVLTDHQSLDDYVKTDDSRLSDARPASDVFAWAKEKDKPTYTASEVGALANTVTHLSGDIATTEKGAANGVATLGSDGKIPSGQLPSYVDDVLEYAKKSDFPVSGESGKIYVDKATNLTWRWSGSAYVEISPSLALGETSSTAYAGDKGKALADKLAGIAAGAEVNVQSDWNVTDTASDAYIKNKPTIPSAVTESTVSGWGFTKNTGTYSKPSGGIPKTDLASAVQTSLGKADTALQEHQSLDNYVKTDDSRLSDSRTPKAHTHTTSDITGFDFSEAVINRGRVGNTTDFNTLTDSGCYKVQSWGDAAEKHSPNEYGNIYSYGLLFVLKPNAQQSEDRILQIYFPNRPDENTEPVLMRMHNGSTWHTWHRLSYNTWRGIQNNLTSDSTTDSLSAAQGKALKALIDGKADKSAIPTVDTALSSTSTNPVQNKVIKAAFDDKADKTTGNATTAGLTKLYTTTGTNTDGAMTQKAVTDALSSAGGSIAELVGNFTLPELSKSTLPIAINLTVKERPLFFIMTAFASGSAVSGAGNKNELDTTPIAGIIGQIEAVRGIFPVDEFETKAFKWENTFYFYCKSFTATSYSCEIMTTSSSTTTKAGVANTRFKIYAVYA